jgi:DNA-binding transcriptional LysR family regulator
VGSRFEEIEAELDALAELREKPAGTVRITAGEHPAYTVLAPALAKLLPSYPDIKVEVSVDYGFTDIVAQRYDAGVRIGEDVAKDMIAVRIGPDMRMAVVGAPPYFETRPPPKKPQDLTEHNCINVRMPTYGGLYAWEFEKGKRELRVRVDGQLVCNTIRQRLDAALAGLGLAYMPEDVAQPHIARGALIRALEDWCAPFSGYHLYYPSRRQSSPAFVLLVDALRYRG